MGYRMVFSKVVEHAWITWKLAAGAAVINHCDLSAGDVIILLVITVR